MAVKKTSYVLDNDNEFDRLELQAKQQSYSLREELKFLKVLPGMKILDAGCGSGVVSKHLSASCPDLKIKACDFSEIRIHQTKIINKSYTNIEYEVAELSALPFEDNSFDIVISRYVYEYLADPVKVTSELRRVLKPGGNLYLIDLDGVFLNFWTNNSRFNELLFHLSKSIKFDLYVGKKLPSFLKLAGFEKVDWEVTVHPFHGNEIKAERENNRVRLEGAAQDFIKALGSKNRYDEFCQLYLDEMDAAEKNGNVMYFNKFISWGVK